MTTQLSSQRIDASFDTLVSQLNESFPNADICERLALNRLRHALARQQEVAETTSEIHPAASADPEIRRAYAAADRDFWRALRYLQRRLDHRARLAERRANPTPAYAATLFQPDSTLAPEKTQLTPTTAKSPQPAHDPAFDLLPTIDPARAAALDITIAPANKPLTPTLTQSRRPIPKRIRRRAGLSACR